MSKEIFELKEKRAGLVAEQRKLVDLADTEKREFTSDEDATYQRIDVDFEALTTQIGEMETREAAKAERLRALEEREKEPKAKPPETREQKDDAEERMGLFNRALVHGVASLSNSEVRALSAGTDTEGGYIVAPEQFVNKLIKGVDDMVYVRQKATVIPVAMATSLGVPTLDTDPADADWTTELATGSADSDMALGKRSLTPTPIAKRIKVSRQLIRQALQSADSLVRGRLGYKFGITHEKAFLTGSGSGQPLGLFTASAKGISTSRDVSTDNTTTLIKADNLINTKFSLKAQYQKSAEWLFHRDAVKMIRKLKDGNGDYLWKQGLGDKMDTILELPYSMSEYAPNTFTTGLYVGLLGDLSFYWIADALGMTIQVLNELYSETNQIGYIGRMESDGMPVLEEAFARVTLG